MMVRQQVEHKINTPNTSSMGRLFDAVSALLGICERTSYEAQAAIELQHVAQTCTSQPAALRPYPFEIDHNKPVSQVRLAALFDTLLFDIEHDKSAAEIAARFHITIVEMILRMCSRIREETGINTVALSGGVFQNQLLVQYLVPKLLSLKMRVLLHQKVPCNDGGVSLGQAVIAGVDAIL
jgi:hydrogenase maturation protein HypF